MSDHHRNWALKTLSSAERDLICEAHQPRGVIRWEDRVGRLLMEKYAMNGAHRRPQCTNPQALADLIASGV